MNVDHTRIKSAVAEDVYKEQTNEIRICLCLFFFHSLGRLLRARAHAHIHSLLVRSQVSYGNVLYTQTHNVNRPPA